MKFHVTLLFFASALVSGCTNTVLKNRSNHYPSNSFSLSHVRITDHDSRDKEYCILSVRGDSELVVLDWEEAGIEPIPFPHAIVLTKDIIAKVYRFGGGRNVSQEGDPKYLVAPKTESGGIVAAPGGIIGGIASAIPIVGDLAGEIAKPSGTYTLDRDKDWQYLRSISAYPDKEPDEMQYIK